jgi:YVTN family beta-propeller protein
MWMALAGTGEVVQVDPGTGDVLARLAVGQRPIALLYDGTHLWSADSTSDTVTRIDPERAEKLASIAVGDGPYALAWLSCGADCGELWVANEKADTVSRIRVIGNQ